MQFSVFGVYLQIILSERINSDSNVQVARGESS